MKNLETKLFFGGLLGFVFAGLTGMYLSYKTMEMRDSGDYIAERNYSQVRDSLPAAIALASALAGITGLMKLKNKAEL